MFFAYKALISAPQSHSYKNFLLAVMLGYKAKKLQFKCP